MALSFTVKSVANSHKWAFFIVDLLTCYICRIVIYNYSVEAVPFHSAPDGIEYAQITPGFF